MCENLNDEPTEIQRITLKEQLLLNLKRWRWSVILVFIIAFFFIFVFIMEKQINVPTELTTAATNKLDSDRLVKANRAECV